MYLHRPVRSRQRFGLKNAFAELQPRDLGITPAFRLNQISNVPHLSPDTQGEISFATFVCGGVFQQLAVAHDLSGKSEFCLSGEVSESRRGISGRNCSALLG